MTASTERQPFEVFNMIIDSHCHVIASDTTTYPLAPIFGRQSAWSAEHPLDYPDMIKAMDEAGVAQSVLVQASSAYAFDNTYVAEAVAAHPDRFTGVFSIDVVAPDAVERMQHWTSRGLTGMRIFTAGSTQPVQQTFFAEPPSYAMWDHAGETGLSVCMQMQVKGFDLLRDVMDRFPKVKIILDHFARADASDGPPYAKAQPVFDLARYPNLFLKLTHRPIESSMKPPSTTEAFMKRVVDTYGARRIMWGSNFPAAPQSLPEGIALAREALSFLSASDQDWIFYKTAQELYPALTKR